MTKSQIWTFCKIAVILLAILTFTPLVTPAGKYKPELLGMPYTLWVGILDVLIIVGLTWLGTRVHPGRELEK